MGRDDLTSWPSRQFIEVLMWKICPCPTKSQLAGPGLPKLFAAIIHKLYQILTILPFPTPNLNLDRSSLHILLIYYPWLWLWMSYSTFLRTFGTLKTRGNHHQSVARALLKSWKVIWNKEDKSSGSDWAVWCSVDCVVLFILPIPEYVTSSLSV